MFAIDNQSGSGENPVELDLTENKTALVIVMISDNEASDLESLKNDIINIAVESIDLSGLSVSNNKYCYVFERNEEKGFVEYDLRVSTNQIDEEGNESFVLSEDQGTYVIPNRIEFGDKQSIVVLVVFCDENRINSNFARAAQAQACGFLESSAETSSLRFVHALTPVDDSSKVLLRVQRGVFVDD